jgi:rhamnosyltransferase
VAWTTLGWLSSCEHMTSRRSRCEVLSPDESAVSQVPLVVGVVVAYYPDLEKLRRLLGSAAGQVDQLVVIDNGANAELGAWIQQQPLRVTPQYVPMRQNTGIGAAQNAGIRIALRHAASHVLLLDQDSYPDQGMVRAMLDGESRLLGNGVKLAAVGPQLHDEATGRPFRFIQFPFGIKKWANAANLESGHIVTHHLVASGTMIRTAVFERVGLMREELFIEYVDVEWGLRARSYGFVSFGIPAARMSHNLGDKRATVLFGLKTVPLHSPLRHYYTMRNAIFMQKLSYVPAYWKIHDVMRTVASFFFFALYNVPRWQQVAMMLRGLRDGFGARMGRYAD